MTPAGLLRLKLDEGCRLVAYPDPWSPRGLQLQLPLAKRVSGWESLSGAPWTIGYGHTGPDVHDGLVWTQAQADAQLAADVAAHERGLRVLAWFQALDPVRQDVLINIAFNVGVAGLMHWPQTLGHFAARAFPAAANDLRNEGKWNRDVGKRADRLAAVTEAGDWAAAA